MSFLVPPSRAFSTLPRQLFPSALGRHHIRASVLDCDGPTSLFPGILACMLPIQSSVSRQDLHSALSILHSQNPHGTALFRTIPPNQIFLFSSSLCLRAFVCESPRIPSNPSTRCFAQLSSFGLCHSFVIFPFSQSRYVASQGTVQKSRRPLQIRIRRRDPQDHDPALLQAQRCPHPHCGPRRLERSSEISKYAVTGVALFSTTTLEILKQQAFDLAVAFQRDADAEDLDVLKNLWTLIRKAKNTNIRERHPTVQEQKIQLRREKLALKRDLLASKNCAGTSSTSPTSVSRDALTTNDAAPADPNASAPSPSRGGRGSRGERWVRGSTSLQSLACVIWKHRLAAHKFLHHSRLNRRHRCRHRRRLRLRKHAVDQSQAIAAGSHRPEPRIFQETPRRKNHHRSLRTVRPRHRGLSHSRRERRPRSCRRPTKRGSTAHHRTPPHTTP